MHILQCKKKDVRYPHGQNSRAWPHTQEYPRGSGSDPAQGHGADGVIVEFGSSAVKHRPQCLNLTVQFTGI